MADEAAAKGYAAYSAGNFAKAINHYTVAINLAPTNHVLYANRSAAYASLNQYSEALSDAKKTVHLKPDWFVGYSHLGAAHHGLKQYDEAIKDNTVAINLAQTNHVLYSNRSAAYASLNQYSEALSDAKKTVHLKPDWFVGYSHLGAAHQGLKQYDEAINHYTDAINLAPTDHFLYLNRSVAYASLNQYSEALSDAKKTVHLKPDWAIGYSRLGMAHHCLKQYNEAILVYKIGLEVDPSNETLKSRLKDAESAKLGSDRPGMGSSPPKKRKRPADEAGPVKKKKREAEVETEPEPMDEEERELKEKKVNAQKEKEKGNAAYKKKDFKTAIECYTKAVELDNGDISFLTNMAKKSKDYEPEIETFQKALIEHRNPDTLKELNDAERAKKELEQQEYYDHELAEKEREKGLNNFYMPICRDVDLMESTKSLNTIALKHNELLLAHTSDIKRLNEKITAECKELYEDFQQKCIQLEAENKLLQQREDELKKTEVELKNRERKIVKERSKLEFNKRARELLSSCKQLDNKSFRKEDEDGKRELCALHKRTMELEDQVKVQNESLQRARMELETVLQVSEDEEKFKNLQSELETKREQLQELKNLEKGYTLAFVVKDDELQDARLELIDSMKTNHKLACIGVKTLDMENGNMKCPRRAVHQLWHNKEKREASVTECIEYIMKKWKAERKQTMN